MPENAPDGRPRALVLGTEQPRSAAVVRSLAAAGIAVDVCDHVTPPNLFWRTSRCIRNRYQLSPDPGAAMDEIAALGEEGGGVLIPTNDHYLVPVSRQHGRLSRRFTVTVPPWDVLEPLMDMVMVRRLIADCGLKAAKQFVPGDASDLQRVVGELDLGRYDYIMRARRWDFGSANTGSLQRVGPAGGSPEEISAKCLEYFERTGHMPILEEVIPGGAEQCIGVTMVVGRDHSPILAYSSRRRKLQLYAPHSRFTHPYHLGANAYCESARDEEAMAAAVALAARARYRGMMTFEFKRSPADGTLYVLKADPRFVNSARLAAALGQDMPVALYEEFLGGDRPRPAQPGFREGVRWIWIEAYLSAIWRNRKDISVLRELLRLAALLPRVRAYAYFAWSDPLPGMLLFFRTLKQFMRHREGGRLPALAIDEAGPVS